MKTRDVRYLLDTHVVVRWLAEPKRLTRDQMRVLGDALAVGEPVGLSAISILEIGVLLTDGARKLRVTVAELFNEIEDNPIFQIVPIDFAIGRELASVGRVLPDPADRLIVATARVHRLRLLTSDQRIVDSGLVETID